MKVLKQLKVYNGVIIESNFDLTNEEAQAYIEYAEKKNHGKKVEKLVIELMNDDDVRMECHLKPIQFEKVRRITGYLVGTVDRFNNGKKAEERDRVKHNL